MAITDGFFVKNGNRSGFPVVPPASAIPYDANTNVKDKIDTKADTSAVETALAGKQNTLTFDDSPTNGSTNPVKSDGVYDALTGKADNSIVAAEFNAGTSYTAGNYCIHEGKFYKFKNNHSGAWAAADVDEIKIAGELSALNSNLSHKVGIRTYTLADSVSTYSIPCSTSSAYMMLVSIPLGASRVQDGFYLITRQGTEIVKKDIGTDDLTLTVTLSGNDMVLTWTASNPYGGSVTLIPIYEVD